MSYQKGVRRITEKIHTLTWTCTIPVTDGPRRIVKWPLQCVLADLPIGGLQKVAGHL
ncbi:hypothetical protein M413DRAFT_442154 [Hebeloma cylindrosporum]|uniref:Uncharacterized protein n=1 Tax=Hebeloma cylindrosporum TaxID=76867 RepID=A0A0C2Y6K6_HEBCY|nr:hypothetical protein M413DRAFT_442154 [Hebeloma cylindrosporum h7]